MVSGSVCRGNALPITNIAMDILTAQMRPTRVIVPPSSHRTLLPSLNLRIRRRLTNHLIPPHIRLPKPVSNFNFKTLSFLVLRLISHQCIKSKSNVRMHIKWVALWKRAMYKAISTMRRARGLPARWLWWIRLSSWQ